MSEQQVNTPATESNVDTSEDSGEELEVSQEASTKLDASTPKTEAKVQQQIAKLKKLKLKIDGEEFEEELPFEIDDNPEVKKYLERHLQLSKVSQKRMQEKATLEKEVADFISELRDNPRAALAQLSELGVDARKMAAKIIEEEIEQAKKSPEQIEKEKLEEELKALREEREREKEEAKQKELTRLEQQEYDRYNKSIDEALSGSTLPKSNYIKSRIADYMLMGLQNNINVDAKDIIPLVEADLRQELKDMFSAAPEDIIEAFVGRDNINRVRKKHMANRKAVPTTTVKAIPDTGSDKKGEDNTPKKTIKELFGV